MNLILILQLNILINLLLLSILGKYPTYVAFGNDHNDIEMLQHAKVGYFVNNESMDVSILKISVVLMRIRKRYVYL